MKKTKEPKTPFTYRKHSDTIVATIISSFFALMLTICTIFAYITVDNRTTATGGGGVTLTNPQIILQNTKIAPGGRHNLALVDGKLYAWGDNTYGQLGIDNTTNQSEPIRVGTEKNWTHIEPRGWFSAALNSFGELWAWGRNEDGQLGIGNTINQNKPVKVGLATNWMSFAQGGYHNLALNSLGELWAWGSNSHGQLGLGNTTNQNTPMRVGTQTDWVSVHAGDHHSFAINVKGELWGWGKNDFGQLGIGNYTHQNKPVKVGTTNNWISFTQSGNHCIVVNDTGELWAWGRNASGEIGIGNTTNQNKAVRVGTATNWVTAVAANDSSFALNDEGELWSWGDNTYGQLGLGDATVKNRNTPGRIAIDQTWNIISAGAHHVIAVNDENEYFSFGWNASGQLGLGDTINRTTPIQMTSLSFAITLPNSVPNIYTISAPPDNNVYFGDSFTFTITPATGYVFQRAEFTSPNGKLNYSGIDLDGTMTVKITNITGNITATDFTIYVSRTT